MANVFISNENKGVIWQLLVDNQAFTHIPESKFHVVKNLYENIFNEVNSYQKSLSLIDRNKLVISEMMKKLEFIKTQRITPPLQEVKINMDKALENKQEEFIKLVKRPTQPDINFSDKSDTSDLPIQNEEMDTMLNSMINKRQTEFNLSTKDQSGDDPTTSLDDEPKKSSQQLKSGKKVSFSDNNNIDFLSKFKKQNSDNFDSPITEVPNETINQLLSQLLKNQELILKELSIIRNKK